ncbi:hypothetical protein MKEN_00488700 [Mycena kentingensis (nom. inval.)]|nr:hypothetical protein MKEN_00488700 [Mycena kentingensis (nom. inval.)]
MAGLDINAKTNTDVDAGYAAFIHRTHDIVTRTKGPGLFGGDSEGDAEEDEYGHEDGDEDDHDDHHRAVHLPTFAALLTQLAENAEIELGRGRARPCARSYKSADAVMMAAEKSKPQLYVRVPSPLGIMLPSPTSSDSPASGGSATIIITAPSPDLTPLSSPGLGSTALDPAVDPLATCKLQRRRGGKPKPSRPTMLRARSWTPNGWMAGVDALACPVLQRRWDG